MNLSAIVLLIFGVLLLGCAVGLVWCLKVDQEQDDRVFEDEDIPFMKTVSFILSLFGAVGIVVPFTELINKFH